MKYRSDNHPSPDDHQRERGFTLIELMVSMVIMAFGILGFLFLQSQSSKARTFAREMDRATVVAMGQLEELRALNYESSLLFDDDSDTNPTKYPSSGTSITIDADTEVYDQVSIGNFNYYHRYEVTTDRSTRTKRIDLYLVWFTKEQKPDTTVAMVPHNLGGPITLIVSEYK